jgi:tRNA threonylcarbamoyl adenosine modification protein YjeE
MAENDFHLTIELADEAATVAFAEDVAACLLPGDLVALSGGLGVGKTSFARAVIRAIADDPALEVPSPTFTLVQTYSGGRMPVAHFDLYRVVAADELGEIGFDDAALDGAVLVEWPDRAGSSLPAERLDIGFEIAGAGRRASLTGGGTWPARLARSLAFRAFLDRSGWRGATRRHIQGDASTRIYERVREGSRRAVLMDWPPAVAAAIKDRRAAHRARDVRAFVAVDAALRIAGLSAPVIYANDLGAGFLLLEDLGSEGILRDGAPDPERYRLAIEVLAAIHVQPRPPELPLPDGTVHRLPAYGADALAVEIEFFTDWYVPHVRGEPLAAASRREFDAIWQALIGNLAAAERSWVLLDFHSPNLLWLGERQGLERLGLLDFQDMLIGPSAYDVVSLCQDARATVPASLEEALRRHYVSLRRSADPRFDAESFFAAYAILAAQRATKILGVFARLADHGGKPRYLQHIPRLRKYLARSLAHPVLSALALWYERHLPAPTDETR